MRILQVSYTYYPFLEMGGPPVKVQSLAERLARRGHDVAVLTANHRYMRDTEVRDIADVEVTYLRTVARYRLLTINPGVVPFCLDRLRGFQVVHIYGLYELLGPVAAFFCRRWKIPYVVEPLGMFRPMIRSLLKKRVYHRLLGHRLMDQANAIIATSEHEQLQLLEDGLTEDRLVLRRNGIELEQFERLPPQAGFRQRHDIRPDTPVVLFLGRVAPIKSLELLIEAVAMLPQTDVRLVLVGPPEVAGYQRFLKDTAARLRVDARITFTGPLFGEAKLQALAAADIFVLPSEGESFGNAAAEALACGIPVVVTEGCGIAPFVRDRAGLVVRHDAPSLSAALQRLLTDRGLSRRFRSAGPRVARELSWDEPVAEMEEMYERLRQERVEAQDPMSA